MFVPVSEFEFLYRGWTRYSTLRGRCSAVWLLLAGWFASQGWLPACGQDRFQGVDAYIQRAMEKWQVPGLAFAVVKDGQIVITRGYGTCALGLDRPVTPGTLFPIASCTKSFTAASVAMLVDEGKLHWDDRVRQHLPDFRVADAYVSENMTIRDLLCHRTGLVRGDLMSMTGTLSREQMLERVQHLEQAAPHRSKFTYHNVMYAVLGELIEKCSGMPWSEFVASRIFKPLGMTSTTTHYASVDQVEIAVRHRFYDEQLAPLRMQPNDQLTAEAGAIYSTANDMAKWLLFQLREGAHEGRQLIAKKTHREMHALQHSIPVVSPPDANIYRARFVGTGLGWFVRDYRGRKLVQHGGAWGADVNLVPEENLGIVVLSNRDWNSLVWMLSFACLDTYLTDAKDHWISDKNWDYWLPRGGPNAGDQDLKTELKKLQEQRAHDTKPTLPLSAYEGHFESNLYADLIVSIADGRLSVKFGRYEATLEHWENDTFYGHAVIEPFFDWLVHFSLDGQQRVESLEILNVGWKDPDERFLFTRKSE